MMTPERVAEIRAALEETPADLRSTEDNAIGELLDSADALRDLREALWQLVKAWREKADSGQMPTDREIGYEYCANDLESTISREKAGARDWKLATEHLKEVRRQYTEIGAAGLVGLTIALNPLLIRLEKGERTTELYEEIMATE